MRKKQIRIRRGNELVGITPIHIKKFIRIAITIGEYHYYAQPLKYMRGLLKPNSKKKTGASLEDSQAAFRADRSTQNCIFITRQLSLKSTTSNKEILISTIVLEKAFDILRKKKLGLQRETV